MKKEINLKTKTIAEAIEKLNAIIDKLNGDWVPDWNNYNEEKNYVIYDHFGKKYIVIPNYRFQRFCIFNYMKSKEIATKIINEHKDLLDIVFDIKE